MKKYLQDYVIAELIDTDNRKIVVLGVGIATFFFGFGAGAILNLYLFAIQSPLVLQLRSSLSYKSAILGDGVLLPVVNMVVMVFLLRHWKLVKKRIINAALFLGIMITLYFHVTQALGGIVNWAMPKPWEWNALGVWHGVYMFAVTSFLSLFYLLLFKVIKRQKYIPKEAFLVTAGIIIFFVLLRLDYLTVSLENLIPRF